MRRAPKLILITSGAFFLLALLFFVGGTRGMREMRSHEIAEIDMTLVEDGTHYGSSSIHRWAVDVAVMVRNHQIVEIQVLDTSRSNLPDDITSKINRNLIAQEQPLFDAVSGATMTSKGYLIAVADALGSGRRPSSPSR